MSFKLHATLFTVGLMSLGYFVTPVAADQWDKMTIFHFNRPVEVPGHVLIPGTYMFKLADLQADRDVVQIFSQDKKGMDHLVTTSITIPAYMLKTPEKPIITFEERRANNPEAVHTWFYPGDHYGWEFVYPKAEHLQAAASVTSTPAPPAPSPAPAVAPQPAVHEAPTPSVVERQETVVIAQNQTPAAPRTVQPVASPELPKQLPKTGSEVPLAALLGLLTMGGGASVLSFGLLRSRA
jgi:LPXTG-motif cell wall-anchored protein